ncbi:MAG: hypothetical protein JSU70_16320 [Phycisphaerales bacterium]|nr:MAG: hypothetical protein JSU70_16320 [Phycisphaerales bacterium]
MTDKEKNTNESTSTETNPKMCDWWSRGFSNMMANCCQSPTGADEHARTGRMMWSFMRGCRWFPLAVFVLGILFLLLATIWTLGHSGYCGL